MKKEKVSIENQEWKHFGDAFKALREASGIPLSRVAKSSEVSEGTLKKWSYAGTQSPQQWGEIVRAAAAMRLAEPEINILLTLAGHPSFNECRTILKEGKETIPESDKVEQAINAILAPQSIVPTPRIPLERPQPAEYFRGREKELAELLAELRPGRVVTLCGPGGIGKTALAAAAIWQLAPDNQPPERFPDGIIYHNFYQHPQVALALEHIAHSFGEEIKPTPKEAAQRALAGRRVLLLLDGTEEVDDIRLILDIRNQCGVLITSRSRKDALAIRHDLPALPIEEAIALLKDWGGRRVTNREAAQRISELVGQLPLALRLVGRYLSYTDEEASDYLIWLEKTPLAALDQGKRQEESVPLLLDRSVARLGKQARQILGIVGVIAFTLFTLQAIAAGLGVANEEVHQPLGELVSYSLLVRPAESYKVTHELIHTYARQQLAAPTENIVRLAAYYTDFVNDHQGKFDKLDSVRRHAIELLRSGSERQAWEAVSSLDLAIDGYLDLQGYWTDRIFATQCNLTAAQATKKRQDESISLGKLGTTYYSLGQFEQAIGYCQQALAISKEIGDRHGEGNALGSLGNVYHNLGQMERVIDYHQQALAIAREIGDRRGEGNHLSDLANAYAALGQMEQAIGYYQQAIPIAQKIGDYQGEGTRLGNLGSAYYSLGQFEQAIGYHQQAHAIAREISDHRNEGIWLGNLGLAYAALGQMEQAIGYYQQAIPIAQKIGDRHGEGAHLGNLGNAYRNLGQMEQAIDYHQQALAIAREIGDRRGEGNHLGDLGNVYTDLGQMERAIGYYQQAIPIAQEIGDRRSEGTCLGNLGLAYAALGQMERAISYYQQALAIAREISDHRNEGIWLGSLGNAYHNLGQVEQARQYWQASLHIFEAIKSPYAKTIRQSLSSLQRA